MSSKRTQNEARGESGRLLLALMVVGAIALVVAVAGAILLSSGHEPSMSPSGAQVDSGDQLASASVPAGLATPIEL